METDEQHLIHAETESQDGQNGGTTATPPPTKPTKTGGKKPASVGTASRQKRTTRGTEHASLEEEQRKTAAAQASVEDLQRQLAIVEAALAEERQKAAAVTHAETSERTTEQMPGGEAAFGLMPLVGFRGTDLFNVGQQIAGQAIKQPPLVLKHYTNFLQEMGRVMTGRSTVEPDARDKRFLDEVWKTNPFYHLYLQTYLTWDQSLKAFIDAGLMRSKKGKEG